MEALKAIGWQKAIRFIWTGVYAGLLHWSFFPQARVILLRLVGVGIGADTVVFNVSFANLYHYGFGRLKIGKRTFVGDEVMFDMRGGITIGDDVTISNRVTVVTHINVGYPQHPIQKIYPTKEERVVFKNGCYIGTGAIILSGVTIGEMSVVGAGAVVTRDVPSKTVVVGVPAHVIKKI